MTTTATFNTKSSLSLTNITICSHINGLNFPTGYGQIPLFNSNLAIQNYVNARNAELLMAAKLNSASLNYTVIWGNLDQFSTLTLHNSIENCFLLLEKIAITSSISIVYAPDF